MWITAKADFATRAVLVLALAYDGSQPMKLTEIAERTAVPVPTSSRSWQFRGAGIVRSERGSSGGYRLSHQADDLTLERVVRVFQGQLAPRAPTSPHLPSEQVDRGAMPR